VGVAKESIVVPLAPEGAQALWSDHRRWATFVEGFAHVVEADPSWPEPGSKLVWQSVPGGRGRVTEKVRERSPRRFSTEVFEEALIGMQTVHFTEDAEGTLVEIELDYELADKAPLSGITDRLFIRRAQRQSLARTLRRFATEAEEEASL
jgi:Polyketide cyclase / dehydrase and lipid transport